MCACVIYMQYHSYRRMKKQEERIILRPFCYKNLEGYGSKLTTRKGVVKIGSSQEEQTQGAELMLLQDSVVVKTNVSLSFLFTAE